MVNVVTSIWSHDELEPEPSALRSPRGDLDDGQFREASGLIDFPVVHDGPHAAGIGVNTMNTMATAAEIDRDGIRPPTTGAPT